jgi:hypothetical protein
MDVGAVLVAGAQPFDGVQPGESALDHPPVLAEAGAVGDAGAGDPQRDAQGAAVDQGPHRPRGSCGRPARRGAGYLAW